MSIRHSNISVFVPHIGCPNKCSFCDQRHITGVCKAPDVNDVIDAVNTAQSSKYYDGNTTEIAFFGGSFTAIDRGYMIELLSAAYTFVKDKTVSGIRISTRPDAIDDEILEILKEYGVTSIELGAQSMNDTVLKMNNRGHSAEDVYKASFLIKNYGFSLGLQMMTGLYGSDNVSDTESAKKFIEIKPDTVRIYPTIVLKDTVLAKYVLDGKYKPQTLDNAVTLCANLLKMFNDSNINVIRLGLHTIEQNSYVAGPWHPAFSELCYSKLYLDKVISQLKEKGEYTVYVNPSSISKMIGQSRKNIIELNKNGFKCTVKPKADLKDFEIITERSR